MYNLVVLTGSVLCETVSQRAINRFVYSSNLEVKKSYVKYDGRNETDSK